jgi:hypothetical protein
MNAVGKLAVGPDGILVATVLPEVSKDRRLLDVHEEDFSALPLRATTSIRDWLSRIAATGFHRKTSGAESVVDGRRSARRR